jgi:hypothetical protein
MANGELRMGMVRANLKKVLSGLAQAAKMLRG